MKTVYFILTFLFTVSISAQHHELLKHNGEKLEVNYIKTDHNLLYYSYPNHSEFHTISKYAVASLSNKSNGHSRVISTKAKLDTKKELKNVIFLKENETVGLKKGEHVSCFLGVTKGMSHHDLEELKKLKLAEKAFQKGSPFVVITSVSHDKTHGVLYHY